jgi:trehalose synthase
MVPGFRWSVFLVLVFALTACSPPRRVPTPVPGAQSNASSTAARRQEQDYVAWLKQRSMLSQAAPLAEQVSGRGLQWRHPYAKPQPKKVLAEAPVWFHAYPAATITPKGRSVIQTLGSDKLWALFEKLGVRAMHTGPVKLAGGYKGRNHTPTVDGWFDRISLSVDPAFGTDDQYRAMAATAASRRGAIAGDLVPGHTGKGADYLLALRQAGDYDGIYDMVEIKPRDWDLLPEVDSPWKSKNLSPQQVEALTKKSYLPGTLERVLFADPNAQGEPTGYDATAAVTGVDGVKRRFVYLHYFKPGQPTMNWCDPSMGAQRIVAGDIVKTIRDLGARIVRLDANPFLGIEPKPDSTGTWSEGHPLSVASTDLIAWMVRKLGGHSFQELNMDMEAIKRFSEHGPDLSYDFITRPAVEHAALAGDATFLRFKLDLMQQYQIDPARLVHDLQNHDEITYELVHLDSHATEVFDYEGEPVSGEKLRERIRKEMKSLALSDDTPYNKPSGNGLCTTFAGLAASRLGLSNPYDATPAQVEQIRRIHLLMAAFNALQPGVFGVSGWDLVGALPLHLESIPELVKDGDYRWVNRGAYDLLGEAETAAVSGQGLPRAQALYGDVPSQLQDPNSFASRLQAMIQARSDYGLARSELLGYPPVRSKGVVLMAHLLPDHESLEITAVNFGDDPAVEVVDLTRLPNTKDSYGACLEILEGESGPAPSNGQLTIRIPALSAKALVLQ